MVIFDGRAPGTPAAVWSADGALASLPTLELPSTRTVVVAAHPDDETLGAGGLIRRLWRAGNPAEVVIVSDGAASHPGSPTVSPPSLAERRRLEARRALSLLSPGGTPRMLSLPDGGLDDAREAVAHALRDVLGAPGSDDDGTDDDGGAPTVVAPWRGDGHRDHRVVGEICAELAAERGATLLEYPVWMWHWATPDHEDVPWSRLRRLPLDADELAVKGRAVAAHDSQLRGLSEDPADAPILHPDFLAHFARDSEVFVTSPAPGRQALDAAYFAAAYARHPDPWGFTTRWYEQRKRALTLAVLPEKHYGRVLEFGCSLGLLTDELARRSDRVLATDIADAAVAAARARTAARPNVEVRRHDLAQGIPEGGPFDLLVLSEVGYYLTRPGLERFARRLPAALAEGGTVVACHWRHPVADYPLTGDAVHAVLAGPLGEDGGLARLVEHREDDFLLDVWCADPRSVAAREGLA